MVYHGSETRKQPRYVLPPLMYLWQIWNNLARRFGWRIWVWHQLWGDIAITNQMILFLQFVQDFPFPIISCCKIWRFSGGEALLHVSRRQPWNLRLEMFLELFHIDQFRYQWQDNIERKHWVNGRLQREIKKTVCLKTYMYKYNTWQFLKLDEAQGYGKCISNYYFCQKRNKDTNTKANTHIVIETRPSVVEVSP